MPIRLPASPLEATTHLVPCLHRKSHKRKHPRNRSRPLKHQSKHQHLPRKNSSLKKILRSFEIEDDEEEEANKGEQPPSPP
jgi:hypothetical protein